MNTWTELAATLEKTITEVIDDAYPHAWDEDHLSYQLLHRIHGSLQSRPYLRGHERVRVTMECYKQTGGQERNFGDIGLLITVAHKGSAPITGVAYLEAKRRREHTVLFPEIKVSQAQRISPESAKSSIPPLRQRVLDSICRATWLPPLELEGAAPDHRPCRGSASDQGANCADPHCTSCSVEGHDPVCLRYAALDTDGLAPLLRVRP